MKSLNSFIPLTKEQIQKHLASTSFNRPIDYYVFSEIDSTNRFLKELPIPSNYAICCAETQTQGRGRFSRVWVSPFGENIYLSIRHDYHGCLSKLSGLSLVVSLALLNSIKKQSIQQDIRIKWPNDLIWNHKKLGGILIEILTKTNGCIQIIIGIGLNVNTHTKERRLTDKPWCSLYELTGQYFDRNALIADILVSTDEDMKLFLEYGFSYFQTRWQQADYLRDKIVDVNQFQSTINGLVLGVSNAGELHLIDTKGREHYLSSGDTSLSAIT